MIYSTNTYETTSSASPSSPPSYFPRPAAALSTPPKTTTHRYHLQNNCSNINPPAAAMPPLPSTYIAMDMSMASPTSSMHQNPHPHSYATTATSTTTTTTDKSHDHFPHTPTHSLSPSTSKDLEQGSSLDHLPFQPCERVVIFTAAYYVCDGVSLTIRKLRAHLRSKGIESRVVSCGPDGWSEPDVFKVPAIPLPIVNADDNFGYSLGIKLTQECKDQIKKFDPSLIHFTVPDFLALDALRWAKAEGFPVMGTWHSNYSDYLKFYHLNVMRGTVEKYIRSFYVNMPIYVPTPFIRTKLLDNGFPKSRVGIWGRGVNLSMFAPTNRSLSFRRERGIADDEVVILWVGRLVKEKSPDIWAECIRRLHRDGHKFRAFVVGTGSYEEEMKCLPNTECLGWMSGEALAEVYASVDVFLFPSEVETFGNVTLEALASGVPCIASAGCSGHLVYHGINGFVVHKADVEEYYALTKRLVLDPSLRQRLATKARPSILTFEHGRVMDMMLHNYDRVIRDHHAQGLGDPSQRKTGDCYMIFIYYFFSLLILFLTPTLKAYVGVVKFMQRAWSGQVSMQVPPLPAVVTSCLSSVGEMVLGKRGKEHGDDDERSEERDYEEEGKEYSPSHRDESDRFLSPTKQRLRHLAAAANSNSISNSLVVRFSNMLSSLTFTEMRVLMLFVYLFALYIIYQTLRSAVLMAV